MNAATISLIIMYTFSVVVLAICVLKDVHRSVLRASVSLVLAMLAVPLAMLLTHNTLDRLTTRLLHTVDLGAVAPLTEAFPSLEESVVALVHMVGASEIYRLVFLVLLAVLGLLSHFVCRAIEHKKPALAKRSKPISAAIGVAFGLVMIVALMAPTAGYAAEAPELAHILGEYEQITHEGKEDISDEATELQQQAQTMSDTALLKLVRALGGRAIFRATTAVEIDGVKTDLYAESHALDALGEKLALLTATPVENYGDAEYEAIKAAADVIEPSAFLRVLGAEGLSSLSRAWLNGEAFLGIEKPTGDAAIDVALKVVLKRFENTTKDTVADDVRKLAPAVATAIKAFNLYNTIQTPSTPSTPSDNPDAPQTPSEGANEGSSGGASEGATVIDTIEAVVGSLGEALQDEETKNIALEIGIGLLAKEFEHYVVTEPSTPTDPPTEDPTDTPTEDPTDAPTEDTSGVTQAEYDAFVARVTELVLSGIMNKSKEELIAEVKGIRDAIGINLSDALCEEMVNSALDGPYASLFQ